MRKYKELWKSFVSDNKQSTLEINNKYVRYTEEFFTEEGRKKVELYSIKDFNGDIQRFLALKDNYTPVKIFNR